MILKRKRRAIAFVDFENWYFSYKKLYGCKPKIFEWYQELVRQFHKLEIYFFADFSRFTNEMPSVKMVSNHIIDTKPLGKKNMTDFVMLDYIYQIASKRVSPMTYILFSGDGHFEPAVKFLKNKRGKEVIIYGIRGSFNGQLKVAASKYIEIPEEFDQRKLSIRLIVKKLDHVERQKCMIQNPTYAEIAQTVSAQLDIQLIEVEDILKEMLAKQYILKKDICLSNKYSKTLILNKSKLEMDGYY